MDRRLFLGSIIGLALRSTITLAQAQQPVEPPFDPPPAIANVKMIVVGYLGVMSEDKSLLKGFDHLALEAEVAKFMQSRFEAAGYPVVSVDRSQLRDLPQGITDADVLYVSFRLDLASLPVANDRGIMGTASTYLQRGEFGLLSWTPMTQFAVIGEQSSLAKRAHRALLDQAQKSVIDPIIYVKRRGF